LFGTPSGVVAPTAALGGQGVVLLPAYGEGEIVAALAALEGSGVATEPAWVKLEEDWLLGLISDEELMAA
jgi:hypothetical protein